MSFSNSYSMDLFRQQQARKQWEKSGTSCSQVKHDDIYGAEKSDTARKTAEHEYQSEKIAHFYSEMARLNRLGMNPSRQTLEMFYDKKREVQ